MSRKGSFEVWEPSLRLGHWNMGVSSVRQSRQPNRSRLRRRLPGLISRSGEYPLCVGRGRLVKSVAVAVESLQVLRPLDPFVDGETGHAAARLLGEEGDDPAFAVA